MLNNVELLLVGRERGEYFLKNVQRVQCFTHKSHYCLMGFLCSPLLKDILRILAIFIHSLQETQKHSLQEKKPKSFYARIWNYPGDQCILSDIHWRASWLVNVYLLAGTAKETIFPSVPQQISIISILLACCLFGSNNLKKYPPCKCVTVLRIVKVHCSILDLKLRTLIEPG